MTKMTKSERAKIEGKAVEMAYRPFLAIGTDIDDADWDEMIEFVADLGYTEGDLAEEVLGDLFHEYRNGVIAKVTEMYKERRYMPAGAAR